MSLFADDIFGQAVGPATRRRKAAGPAPLFGDVFGGVPPDQEEVSPELQASVLGELGELTGGTLSRVGDALAMPGDYFRGLLAGSPGERVTGRELLRDMGLAGQEDTWGNFLSGLAVEVGTDPLAMLSGPAKALTPAGRAAQKLGLLDNAPTAATRKAIQSGALATADARKALPTVVQRTADKLEATGRTLSTLDPATVGRPLYGTRTARRAITLDDTIKYADSPQAAEREARALLGDTEFNRIRNQRLADSFGIGLPFQNPSITGDFLGKGFGDNYADVLDTLGQAYRWSPVGRQMSALFDNKVGGAVDAEDQLTNIASFRAREQAGGVADSAHTLLLSRVQQSHPEVFSEDGNRILGRYLEGPAAMRPGDEAYVQARPELLNYANWWKNNRQDYLTGARELGLTAEQLADKYGIEYLPRRADAVLEMESRRNRQLNNALSTFTGDMLRRTDAMQVPGGRETILRLSRDPVVAGGKRTATTDTAAAVHILKELQPLVPPGGPDITLEQAEKIARVLHKLPSEALDRAPLFGQHPTEMIGSYMRNRNESMATAKTLYDSLATFAEDGLYTDIPGGRHISMEDAIKRLGLRSYDDSADDLMDIVGDGAAARAVNARPLSGASKQMRERIAGLRGIADPDQVKLSEISIPEEHVNRLLRARDVFSVDEASGSLLQQLDHITAAWKGSILTWPARAVRDLYSGATSNWLEGALDRRSVRAARGLLSSGPGDQTFLAELQSIPRYQGMGADAVNQFYSDLAGTGLVAGGSSTDIGLGLTGRRALDAALPGATPVNAGTILGELAPQSGRTWTEFARDFGTWRSSLKPLAETKNPILRAGEQMNSLTDGINRLSGYLALLKQGFTPEAAARAMKRAHVDYTSLSGFERNVLRRVFPWYSYQSRIFGEVLRQLSEQPGGRYGQLVRATESVQDDVDDDAYITSDLRSQFAVPIPEEWGGVPAPGTQTYLTDLDFPGFDQINMLETPGTVSGAATGTMRQVGMQLHPGLRTLAELMSGQDFFTRRPVGESTSTLDSILRSVTGNPDANVPAIIEKPVEMMPFVGRPLYAARSLLDDRGGQSLAQRAIKTSLNATTGLKVRDKTQEDILRDQVRQLQESVDPYTREFTTSYIPENLQPYVPNWALDRMAVSRSLDRERRAARRKPRRKERERSATGQLFE
jgi:hypothetical protein